MIYKLNINFKENIKMDDENILILFKKLENEFDILDEEVKFYDNIPIEEYNPMALNCYFEFLINTSDKNFEKTFNEFIGSFHFIETFNLVIHNEKKESKDNIQVKPEQIDSLINDIDQLFYIRSKLQTLTNYISSDKKEAYLNLLKSLSHTKYYLKAHTVDLRVTDLYYEMNKMGKTLNDYARTFGIDLNLTYSIDEVKLDKVIFYKIKSSLIDLLYSLIYNEIEIRHNDIVYDTFNLSIKFKQEFNKIVIIIKNKNIDLCSEYKEIFTNSLEKLSKDDETREHELSIISAHKVIKDLGKIYIDENNDIKIKIKLDFILLNATIIQTNLGYFAIDKNNISKVMNFDKSNLLEINGITYYNAFGANLPILNSYENASKVLIAHIKTQNFVFFAKEILYDEEIYVRPLENFSTKYIGDCLLKDTKRALVVDLKAFIGEK